MDREELRKKWGGHSSDTQDNPEQVGGTFEKSNDNVAAKSPYFEVELRNVYIASLKLIRRNGHILYLPYSLQPIVEYIPDDGIYIKTMQQEIQIVGRGLATLADWLGSHRVKWLKQSITGTDDEKEEVFVEDIIITSVFT